MTAKAFLFLLILLVPFTTEEQKITHLLNRMGYGPRPGDIELVKKIGIDKYIEQQLHPERIDDALTEARLQTFESLRMSPTEIMANYPRPQDLAKKLGLAPRQNPNTDKEELRRKAKAMLADQGMDQGLKAPQQLLLELQSQKIIRAVHSERQLQEVMTDFWFNHFNVYWGKGADRWLTTDYEMNAIRPNALGKFKDLLAATAKSPAMLFYLDNHLSSSPDGPDALAGRLMKRVTKRKPGINENYARELMELHTMGVDGGYTQQDVQEVARAFTGWTIDRPQQGGGEFLFRPRMHDGGEKIVLGQRITAGGMRDGEQVIEILAKHPSTAQFISTKLVRRFVSDNPPESLVKRVADIYKKTDGDIREMLRTIFTSDEFYSAESVGAKTKSPLELVASSIRSLNGSTEGSRQLSQMIGRMGQPLYQYQPPTGFPDRGDHWINNGSTIERLNFAVALAGNRVPGTKIDAKVSDPKALAAKRGSPEFQKR